MNTERIQQARNPERFAHLKEGIVPLRICIGNRESQKDLYTKGSNHLSDAEHVDWYEDMDEAKRLGHKAKEYSYVISGISESPKFSSQYASCTGIVVIGRDKETGREISFITHQVSFPDSWDDNFTSDLEKTLFEMKNIAEEGTIDAVIFGGSQGIAKESVEDTILRLREIIVSRLGFYPDVISPKKQFAQEEFVLDTQGRRAFITLDNGDVSDYFDFSAGRLEDIITADDHRSNTTNS